MNGLELFEEMLQDMENTTIDDVRGTIKEGQEVPEEKIKEVYDRFMCAVQKIREEANNSKRAGLLHA